MLKVTFDTNISISRKYDRQVYLYHELGDTYAVEQDVTSPILAQWLEWLNQA